MVVSPFRSSCPRGRSAARPRGCMRALVGRHLDGDGHAVGDHVVDGGALLSALHDLAELLLRRVTGNPERDADALKPVTGLVVPAKRSARVLAAADGSLD